MNGNGSANLQVTIQSIRQSPQLGANGRVQTYTLVTYMVGDNGPFVLAYAPGFATQAQITKDITTQVQLIQALMQQFSPTTTGTM